MLRKILQNPHKRHLAVTVLVAIGLALYLTGTVTRVFGFDLAMVLTLVGGFGIFYEAIAGLLRFKISADLAVGLAAIAALLTRQYPVAAEVILIMLIGEALEDFAVGRTRSGIEKLLALRPQDARVRRNGDETIVPVEEIRPDDVVLVRPGDRIPVDGCVISGGSSVDQSPITGESVPADKAPGDKVFAGTINLHGAMELAVERLGEDTTLDRVIHLVEEAEAAKAPAQRLADRYATFFVPIVLVAAGATFWATKDVMRAVAVLVVACPCALVLATPTAVAAGIGGLVRKGILVKGGAVLESMGKLKAVVFDKTGTLTLAKLRITDVFPAPNHAEADVLRAAAAVERNSEHPIAQLIVERAQADGIATAEPTDFAAQPGLGAQAIVAGQVTRVGNWRFMAAAEVAVPEAIDARLARVTQAGGTLAYVAQGRHLVGVIAVQDTVRHESKQTIRALRKLGVERIVMLTGDNDAAAQAVAARLGIRDVRAGLLPDQKLEALRDIQRQAAPVAMVGDGINDAPSLVAADVGVTLANIGTDIAVEAADLVLVGDDLTKLADAIALGRRTLRTIWQNIFAFAIVVNALGVAAASLGWLTPIWAAVLHQASSLVVVMNSMRLLFDFSKWRERTAARFSALAAKWRPMLAWAAGGALLLYLLSGVHVVRIGEVAVVQHFGRVVDAAEPPGLHVRLPAPFGKHRIVRVAKTRRVEVGFRTRPGTTVEPPAYEWNVQHRNAKIEQQQEEATVWAGDENLVDVNLAVHYRVANAKAAVCRIGERMGAGKSKWDALVRNTAEAALRSELSQRTIDTVLGTERSAIEAVLKARMARALAALDCGLEVQRVCLLDVHPPMEVVPAFREVTSALEDKESRINEATAYQNERAAKARGESEATLRAAEAMREGRVELAAAAAERFIKVADAHADAPETTDLRLYLETIEQVLAGRKKIIIDRAPKGARRILYLGAKQLFTIKPAPAELAEPVFPAQE